MIFAKPDFGYCDCGRPSMCGVTGWCGYCAGRPAMVAAKTTTAAPTRTLRDEFAMAALTALVRTEGPGFRSSLAGDAYAYADAMLKARA